ncbi:MAG: hypothetical protein MJZ34_08810 [Paludibacteraceae bacterium]|nr:hypothetical protein [Paludibacteraceae bacterium]
MTMKENKNTQLQTAKGLGMPAPTQTHQKIVARIYKNYLKKFKKENMMMGVAVIEEPERIPDISIWKNMGGIKDDATNPLLTIEITHNSRNDLYSMTSIRETFDYLPTLCEAFVYNYTTDTWTRFRREKDEIVKEADQDYSQILRCYLHTLLK